MKKLFFTTLILLSVLSLTACQDNSIDNTIGFKEKDGKKMYMKEAGVYAKDEVLTIEGDDYYFDTNSIMTTDTWHNDMYFKENGKMAKNELLDIGNSKYYFGDKGNMIKNNWVNKMTMYSGSDGAILKSTHTPDGFYVGDDGVKMEDPEVTKRKKEYEPTATVIAKTITENLKSNKDIIISNETNVENELKELVLNSNTTIADSVYLGDTIVNLAKNSEHPVDDVLSMYNEIYDSINKTQISLDGTLGLASDFVDAGMSLAEGDLISCITTILNNDVLNNSDNLVEWANTLGYDTEEGLKTTWTDDSPKVIAIMLKLLSGNPLLIGDVLMDTLKLCGLEDAVKAEAKQKLAYAAVNIPKFIAEAKAAWDASIQYNKEHPEEFYAIFERMSNMAESLFAGIGNKFSEYLKTLKPVELDLNKNETTNSAINITITDNEINETLTTASNYSNIQIGDTITFGSYEQDANGLNGQEPIEWNVLDINGDKALLLSKYILDCKEYNNISISTSDTSWESCTLRGWLNNNFYSNAFTNDEKQIINQSSVSNNTYKIPNIGTEGYEGRGNTSDYVFILDYNEVQTYLNTDKKAKKTAYSYIQNIDVFNGDYGYWELRMPYVKKFDSDYVNANGEQSSGMAVVGYTGSYDEYADVDRKVGIRPAVWIKYK